MTGVPELAKFQFPLLLAFHRHKLAPVKHTHCSPHI
jgi:hypothetical protein